MDYRGNPTIALGSKGKYVTQLQTELIERKYLSVGGDDGDFGPATNKALINFQRDNGLDADGICGVLTWEALSVIDPKKLPDLPVDITGLAPVDAMLKLARYYIGYCEKKSNSQLYDFYANMGYNNYTLFGYEADTFFPEYFHGHKNGYEWCAQFYSWLLLRCFGLEKAERLSCANSGNNLCAGCMEGARYYKNKGQFHANPKPGDQIYFGPLNYETHTGIVESVNLDNNTVTTIEGNREDCVARYTYYLWDQDIAGYGRPDWSIVDEDEPEVEFHPIVLDRGMSGCQVKALQVLLIGKGYSCGSYGADGDFGEGTEVALKAYQNDHGINATGKCKADTWAKLLS